MNKCLICWYTNKTYTRFESIVIIQVIVSQLFPTNNFFQKIKIRENPMMLSLCSRKISKIIIAVSGSRISEYRRPTPLPSHSNFNSQDEGAFCSSKLVDRSVVRCISTPFLIFLGCVFARAQPIRHSIFAINGAARRPVWRSSVRATYRVPDATSIVTYCSRTRRISSTYTRREFTVC